MKKFTRLNSGIWVPRGQWDGEARLPAHAVASGLCVRYTTELCDAAGRVERELQRGSNLLTDFGMNALATTHISTLCSYLNLGTGTQTLKRNIQGGNDVTTTITSASSIAVVASQNFFESADAGRTLKINSGIWPELLITAFTDAQHVTCSSRGGVWLPAGTPTDGTFTDVAVHYTNSAVLSAQFTKFNTYDTTATNNNTDIAEAGSSRYNFQRIFLSDVVTGSAWTVEQIGWSDGNGSNNLFGKTNLSVADTVPVGKRYRVTLNVYRVSTPINLSSFSVNWGATIGTYTCDIRQERMFREQGGGGWGSFQRTWGICDTELPGYGTTTYTLDTTKWEGDGAYTALSGYTINPAGTGSEPPFLGSYTSGNFFRTKTLRFWESVAITGGKVLFSKSSAGNQVRYVTIKPTTDIAKASGYRADLIWTFYWTRQLTN
jgi:hypothetical protein